MYSHNHVNAILKTAINTLIYNFVQAPYIHRCEHSIHCELYKMLTVHRSLQGLYPLADKNTQMTSLVHKEWPETIPRPEKNGRRGNFDLAILDPDEIGKHTLENFTKGEIPP